MIHLDTSALVDLVREDDRRRPGAATRFVDARREEQFIVSVHAVCELRAGAWLARDAVREQRQIDRVLAAVTISYPDERFPGVYARLWAAIERVGARIGAIDLLIATSAVLDDAPLATRDVRHFARVPGLQVLSY